MGVDIAGCAKEEDVAYEEEDETDGRKGIEGRDGTEQMLCLWTFEESAFIVSLLCGWYVMSRLQERDEY